MSNRSLDGDLTCFALSGDRTIARFKKTLRFIEAARRESSYIDRSRDRDSAMQLTSRERITRMLFVLFARALSLCTCCGSPMGRMGRPVRAR